jgi:hypothetical protein
MDYYFLRHITLQPNSPEPQWPINNSEFTLKIIYRSCDPDSPVNDNYDYVLASGELSQIEAWCSEQNVQLIDASMVPQEVLTAIDPSLIKVRTRNADGTFVADDPETANINEAWTLS